LHVSLKVGMNMDACHPIPYGTGGPVTGWYIIRMEVCQGRVEWVVIEEVTLALKQAR